MELDPRDRGRTAFSLGGMGHFQFRVMPFGLTNALSSFERLTEEVLRGLLFKKCLCFIDDINVFGKSFKSALDNLKEVFGRIRNAGLKLKPSKCCLMQRQVNYLGHTISVDGVTCEKDKVAALIDSPVPVNVKDVRSLFGTANYLSSVNAEFRRVGFSIDSLNA